MLHEMAKGLDLKRILAEVSWKPFPKYQERAEWEGISEDIKKEWISIAEEYINYEWPAIVTELYLRVKRVGDINTQWRAFVFRRSLLGIFLLAECLEGKGRFMDQVINGTMVICEETSWVQGLNMRDKGMALLDATDNYVDLCCSDTGMLMAWISYLVGDELDAEDKGIRRRLTDETLRRVIRPYLDRSNYWWMGFMPNERINNWNPWCNMNVLQAAALLEYPVELKVEVVEKVAETTDIYIERYPDDGACDEGPMYWGAAGQGVGKIVNILQGMTNGALDGSGIKKLINIGTYFSKVHIHENWFVDFADGDAQFEIPSVVYRFGKLIDNEKLMRLGAMAPIAKPRLDNWFAAYDYLTGIFDAKERAELGGKSPYIESAYFDDCQILCAREKDGSPEGLFLSVKAGNNFESHNHNDIGNFIVFLDGKPLFIDIGTEEYRAQTFSPQRFELWYLQSQYHNCPTVNGAMQHDGAEYRATDVKYESAAEFDRISMDIGPSYTSDAGIKTWKRAVELQRGANAAVIVTDDFALEKADSCSYNFITQSKPVYENGRIVVNCGGGTSGVLLFDNAEMDVKIEEIVLEDTRLQRNWGERLYRVVLTEKNPAQNGERVFRIERG